MIGSLSGTLKRKSPSGCIIDVLQRHPHAAHKTMRHAVEVHGVAVRVLLGSHGKIKRLERNGIALVKKLEDFQNARMHGNGFHILGKFPRILQPQFSLERFCEVLDNALRNITKIIHKRIKHHISIFSIGSHECLILRWKTLFLQQFLKKRRLKPRNVHLRQPCKSSPRTAEDCRRTLLDIHGMIVERLRKMTNRSES